MAMRNNLMDSSKNINRITFVSISQMLKVSVKPKRSYETTEFSKNFRYLVFASYFFKVTILGYNLTLAGCNTI